MTIHIRRYESFTRLALLDIGIVGEPSFVFHSIPAYSDCYSDISRMALFDCSCSIVGGEVAQPPCAGHLVVYLACTPLCHGLSFLIFVVTNVFRHDF